MDCVATTRPIGGRLPLRACGESRQVDPGGLEATSVVELERAGVAGERSDHHVADAEPCELLVDGVEELRSDALTAVVRQDGERLELADAIPDAPGVGGPSFSGRRDAAERVPDQAAVDASQEQERVGLLEQRHVQRAVLAPGCLVVDVGGELWHRGLVRVMNGDPEWFEHIDVVRTAARDLHRHGSMLPTTVLTGYVEPHPSAARGRRAGFDRAAVRLDQAFRDREAKTGPAAARR